MLARVLLAGFTSLIPARWKSGDPKSLELLQGVWRHSSWSW
jgi:hypothetical protein